MVGWKQCVREEGRDVSRTRTFAQLVEDHAALAFEFGTVDRVAARRQSGRLDREQVIEPLWSCACEEHRGVESRGCVEVRGEGLQSIEQGLTIEDVVNMRCSTR